jgi:hypothetical protein
VVTTITVVVTTIMVMIMASIDVDLDRCGAWGVDAPCVTPSEKATSGDGEQHEQHERCFGTHAS